MNNNYIGKDTKKINIDNLLRGNISSLNEPLNDYDDEVSLLARTKQRELIRVKRNQRKRMRRYIKKQVLTVLVGLLIMFLISTHVVQLVEVVGASMDPTLSEGNYSLLNKRAYMNTAPERFDVIAFELIEGSDYYYIKRVIGLPGESVRVEHGSIFINDTYLLDVVPTGVSDALAAKVDIVLGDGEYFVLGDNRDESLDSRDKNFGNVKVELILGKIYINER